MAQLMTLGVLSKHGLSYAVAVTQIRVQFSDLWELGRRQKASVIGSLNFFAKARQRALSQPDLFS